MAEMGTLANARCPVVVMTPFLEVRMGIFPNACPHSACMPGGGGGHSGGKTNPC